MGARGTEMFLPLWLRIMGTRGTGRFNIAIDSWRIGTSSITP
jgi:hypothetical protein